MQGLSNILKKDKLKRQNKHKTIKHVQSQAINKEIKVGAERESSSKPNFTHRSKGSVTSLVQIRGETSQ